jgi:putative PEP-CTERM system TPR-repeat lipoprotein
MKTGLPSSRRRKALVAALALAVLAACEQTPTPGEYLELAEQAYAKGNTEEAVLSLKQALQAEPGNGPARKLLARLYVDDGNGKAAAIELDKAATSGIEEAEIALLRLNALMLERKYEDAIAAVEQFRAGERPASEVAEMLAIRGMAQMSLAQGEAADASFKEALALDGNNGLALTGQAQRALAARKLDEAAVLAKKATEVAPGFAPGWSLLGDLMRMKQDPKAAEAAYSEAIAKRSQNANDLIARVMVRLELDDRSGAAADVKTLRQRGFVNPYAVFGEGLLALRDGKLLPAAEKFQEVLGKFPNYARVSCYAGVSLAATERRNQAITYLESCLSAYPQADTVRRTLAASYSSIGQREKIEPLLRPLVEREKPDPAALELLAQIKLTNNDPKAAADLLRKVAEGEQKDSRGLVNLGLVLTAAGELGEAQSAFAEASAISETKFDPALVEAQALLQTGRSAEGITRLEAVLRERPQDKQALAMLAIAKAQTGDLDRARALFEQSLALAPDDALLRVNLANVLTRQGETERARAELDQVLASTPALAQALGMATALDVQAGETDRARSRIAAAEKAKPGDADVLLVKARFAQTQGQQDEARQLLRQVLKDAGDRSDVLRELGQIELARGEVDEATQLFERLVGRPDRQVQDYLLLAQAAETRGRLNQAREAVAQALALAPDYPAARHADIRLDLRERKPEDARRKLDALKAAAPAGPIPDLLATEGQLLLLERKPEQAVDLYRQAFEAQPSGERAVQLARVQAGTGQGEAAMKTLESWVEKNPQDFRARFVLADSYRQRQEPARAVKLYEDLLDEAPQDVLVLNNLAWLLRAENPARALELANKANSIAPRSPAVLDTLGMLLLDQDKLDPALAALRKANELLPDNPELKLHLAMALVRSGGGEEARKLLHGLEAGQFDGEQREAYEALKDELQI